MRLLKGELIGLKVKVIGSKNKANIGLKGKIVDETKNTITIKHNNKKKMLVKEQNKYELSTEEENIEVEGERLIGRPTERIKKSK